MTFPLSSIGNFLAGNVSLSLIGTLLKLYYYHHHLSPLIVTTTVYHNDPLPATVIIYHRQTHFHHSQHLQEEDVWDGNSSILRLMQRFLPRAPLHMSDPNTTASSVPADRHSSRRKSEGHKGVCMLRALVHGGLDSSSPATGGGRGGEGGSSESGRLDMEICTYLLATHLATHGCSLVVSKPPQYPTSFAGGAPALPFLGSAVDGTGFHVHILGGGARLTDEYIRTIAPLLPPLHLHASSQQQSPVFVCGSGLNDFGQLVKSEAIVDTVRQGKFNEIRFQTGAAFENRLARLGVYGYGTLQGGITGKVLNHVIHIHVEILSAIANVDGKCAADGDADTNTDGVGTADNAGATVQYPSPKLKSNLFQHAGPSTLLAWEYLFSSHDRPIYDNQHGDKKKKESRGDDAGKLEDIPDVLASIGRAATLSSYGVNLEWLTKSNPFEDTPILPPVMTLHYERVTTFSEGGSHQNALLSVAAAVVAKLSFECLVVIFTTDYDPSALMDLHNIAMQATSLQREALARRTSQPEKATCWHGGFLTVSDHGIDFRFALRLLGARQTVMNMVLSRSLLGTSLSTSAGVPFVCLMSDFGTFELTELIGVETRYVFHVGHHHAPLNVDDVHRPLQQLLHAVTDVGNKRSYGVDHHGSSNGRVSGKVDFTYLSCSAHHKIVNGWLTEAKFEYVISARGSSHYSIHAINGEGHPGHHAKASIYHGNDWIAARQRLSLAVRRAKTFHHESAENLALSMLR